MSEDMMIFNLDTQKDQKKDSKSYKIAIFTQEQFFWSFLAFLRTHTFTAKHSLILVRDFWRLFGICQIKTELYGILESIFKFFSWKLSKILNMPEFSKFHVGYFMTSAIAFFEPNRKFWRKMSTFSKCFNSKGCENQLSKDICHVVGRIPTRLFQISRKFAFSWDFGIENVTKIWQSNEYLWRVKSVRGLLDLKVKWTGMNKTVQKDGSERARKLARKLLKIWFGKQRTKLIQFAFLQTGDFPGSVLRVLVFLEHSSISTEESYFR